MDDLITTTGYAEETDSLIIKTEFDNRSVLAANLADRNARPETGKYKGDLVHIGRIHLGDIERLKNLGYNLLSPDPDEVKRSLLYVQSNEKHLLTVDGTPIAKRRQIWN